MELRRYLGYRRLAIVGGVGVIAGIIVSWAAVQRPEGGSIALGLLIALLILLCSLLPPYIHTQVQALHRDLSSEVGAHLALGQFFHTGHELVPALGGFAMRPSVAHRLVAEMLAREPATVVELGPGASTFLAERALDVAASDGTIVALEHDEGFHGHLAETFQRLGMTRVRLVHAPLEPAKVSGWSGRWYALAEIEALPSPIDLLVVDGPPQHVGHLPRLPAYPALRSKLASGACIFVDDTDRHAERLMIERWLRLGGVRIVHDGDHHVVLEVE